MYDCMGCTDVALPYGTSHVCTGVGVCVCVCVYVCVCVSHCNNNCECKLAPRPVAISGTHKIQPT